MKPHLRLLYPGKWGCYGRMSVQPVGFVRVTLVISGNTPQEAFERWTRWQATQGFYDERTTNE